jgi:O-antigen/teichoic acid export membrane protein
MSERKSQIVKNTLLFSGVHATQLVSNLLKSKIIAANLGPSGFGVYSLLINILSLIQQIAACGLDFAAVREISEAKRDNDKNQLGRIWCIFSFWLYLSSIVGAVAFLVSVPFLSDLNQLDPRYKRIHIVLLLSFTIALNILSAGYNAVMQGVGEIRGLAKSAILSSIIGTTLSCVSYFVLKIDGIPLALGLSALTNLWFNIYYYRRIRFPYVRINFSDRISGGLTLLRFGFSKMIASFIGVFCTSIIYYYIKEKGGIHEIGLYQAAMMLPFQLIAVLFTVLTVDYFPRLAASVNDLDRTNSTINDQTEIMVALIIPPLIVLVIYAPYIIPVLLSNEFSDIQNLMRLVIIGVFITSAKQPLDLLAYAKGDYKVFLSLSAIGGISLIACTITGYKIWGLQGVGCMYILHSLICSILIYLASKYKYKYVYTKKLRAQFPFGIVQISLVTALLILFPGLVSNILANLILLVSLANCLIEITKHNGSNIVLNYLNHNLPFMRYMHKKFTE